MTLNPNPRDAMRRRQLLIPALALLAAACGPPDAGEQTAAGEQTDAAEQAAAEDPAAAAELDPGLVTVESDVAFEETYDRLRSAIEGNENLRILAEVDHGANAEGVGRTLPPTRLILFGNPDLGTPLMESARTVAIDLPQKLLVWADGAGGVFITYNDPAYLQRRHGIEGRDEILATIAGALVSLTDGATR